MIVVTQRLHSRTKGRVKRKKFLTRIAFAFVLLMIPALRCYFGEHSFLRAIGDILKVINLQWFESFKSIQKQNRFDWFENAARLNDSPLHTQSGWGYLSEDEYNNMVVHVLQRMSIQKEDSVFEFGCGVGAVLLLIQNIYGKNISVGGSDFSFQQIKRARQIFPKEASRFYVLSMTQKHDLIPNDSIDHVISFGALAMYLYEDEMKITLEEAIRVTKPGGRLCFTHFIEPDGKFIGSILEPVSKSFWYEIRQEYNLKHLIIEQMKHQIDRYFVCFTK